MKAILYFSDYTFDISDINEDMEQTSAVNPVESDADFAIGVSSVSELKFSLNNLYGVISENSLANKEFLLQRGEVTEYESVLDIYKKVRKPLFVQHGAFTFAASDRAPYLSVYDSNFVLQNAPAQPSQPVKSLLIVDGKLYCVHDKEPYLTTYAVSGGVLALQPQVKITDFYKNKLLGYIKNSRCFNKQGNIVIEYVSIYTDMKISDVIAQTWRYSNFGYYTVTKAEKINDTKISVLAYDRMQKFDVLADAFLDGLTYPITIKTLLTKLCTFIGVKLKNRMLVNENYSVPRNFKTDGVTCRQVLQWIAQIAANFAYIDFDGNLNISWYTETDSQINASNSTGIDIADYVVQPIDKVQARAFESDIGVIVPIDERKPNAYIIENNPLLYATSDGQIRPAITNIYNAIKGFSYIPFNTKVRIVDKNVKAGMIISATTIKGTKFNAHIMQSTIKGVTGLTAEYSAIGNEYRKTQVDAVNQRISMLNGRTNTIIANIDEFSVTLTEVKTETQKNTSDIKVVGSRVSTAETKIAQNAEQIALKANLTTVESIENRVSSAESSIILNANEISLKVSQTEYNGNTISSLINQTATSIQIQADKINLQGNVSVKGEFETNYGNNTVKIQEGKVKFYEGSKLTGWMKGGVNIFGIDKNGIYVDGYIESFGVNARYFSSGGLQGTSGSVSLVNSIRENSFGGYDLGRTLLSFSSGLLTHISYI